jgi:nucleoside-diphosphate-sugar epimerase
MLNGDIFAITGGAGFVGTNLALKLLELGKKVVIIDDFTGPRSERNFNTILKGHVEYHDLSVETEWAFSVMTEILRGVDTVFHNAASKCTVCMNNPAHDLSVNALGTLHVLNAAVIAKVKRVVHASTGSVTDIKSYYGVSKLAAESYCRAVYQYSKLLYTVLRYYHVYGPYQDESQFGGVIPLFIRLAQTGKPIHIHGGDQIRYFTHVNDIIKANLYAAEGECNEGPYSVVSPTSMLVKDLLHYLVKSGFNDLKVKYLPYRANEIKVFPSPGNRMIMRYKEFEPNFIETVKWYVNDWAENGMPEVI